MDPTEQASASSTSPSDWKYISEGGATIVFSYGGPSHPLFSGTVLRLRKVAVEHSSSNYREVEEPDDPSIAFQRTVTSQLIPSTYLPHLETLRVDRPWLEELRTSTEHARPSERRCKDVIDVHRRKAVLATDLVGGEGWAVEIKPKWGFLPNLAHLSAETRLVKSRLCRFCMHARYRALKGEVASNEYCPLDLFSGNEERTAHALRCLWKAWERSSGTVNNLKVFVRGKLVDPKDSSKELQFLLRDEGFSKMGEDMLMEAFVAALLPLLTQTPLLRSIARLQRTLDPLDIEGLFLLQDAYSIASHGAVLPLEKLFPDPTLDEWAHFVETYLSPDFQRALDHSMLDPVRLRYYTMAYLLSATFKDLSLMLRLGRDEMQDSITVIDLDPKGMSRLNGWADLDRAIATSFKYDGARCCHDTV